MAIKNKTHAIVKKHYIENKNWGTYTLPKTNVLQVEAVPDSMIGDVTIKGRWLDCDCEK